jgi:N-acetylmuramoyl-L-alanine amidase
MPSILAEISFISNQQESQLLNDDSYRQSIAEGLATGVNRYIQSLAESKLTQNRNK